MEFSSTSKDLAQVISELSGRHLIDGLLKRPTGGQTFPVTSPATGEPIGAAARGGAADVSDAVAAAGRAQKSWLEMPARQRGKLVQECGRVLADHTETLARLLAVETGKAIRTESRPEARIAPEYFHYFGGLGLELKGETIPFHPGMLTITLREPLGVVGVIIPWNVPLVLLALKVAPALVAGNAVVVKSAEQAPLSTLYAGRLIAEVLPRGLVNVVSGFGPECGSPLVDHPDVAKVSFTGSVETGRIVNRQAAEKIIPVTLELGGKSPMLVMPDVDLDQAVEGAIAGMRFTRQGQSCTSTSRIYVHSSQFERFVDTLKHHLDALVIGDPLDERTDVGPVISREQFDVIDRYVRLGEGTPGAVAHRCGKLPGDPPLRRGLFFQPILFTGLPEDSPLIREEIFGPVAVVSPWDDYEALIRKGNDSDFGLAASIWTNDLGRAIDLAKRVKAGYVQINQSMVIQPGLSYGGYKHSGLGREASLESMLDHFTQKKLIAIKSAFP
jgi:acyl-CoA reductase-like NAD-dependent aldehyde dehydrogenase